MYLSPGSWILYVPGQLWHFAGDGRHMPDMTHRLHSCMQRKLVLYSPYWAEKKRECLDARRACDGSGDLVEATRIQDMILTFLGDILQAWPIPSLTATVMCLNDSRVLGSSCASMRQCDLRLSEY
eukprot:gnl/TRDRNA2_/TRDRNA2_173202_c0_seq1.p2 gnl/TRDRNA2_/TRDRNA2_173202_c0~~gnl/TRDRNA2_/TRDRNA2_173202_c0_seq1.p2  ORF type:complete len:125 (-),score=10.99 gnl/TRDRNA2_/TRDRNA2_173202_c0_seq1:89-463(-)